MYQQHASTVSERMFPHLSMAWNWSDIDSLSGLSLDVLSDEEIVQAVNDLRQQVKILKLENEVLEKSIMRLDPTLMNGVYQAYKYYTQQRTSSAQTGSAVRSQINKFKFSENKFSTASKMISSTSRMFQKDSGGRVSIVGRMQPKINIQEKTELLSLTMEHQVKELNTCKRNEKKQQELLKAEMEECELWIEDIKKSTQDFKEQVVVKGYDPLTQRIPAEIWVKYMMEWSKIADKKIGKLRLRTSTLNTHYRRLKDSIVMKQELSRNLTAVDFEKMRIENQEAEKLLEKKNIQLEGLKAMAGDANLHMTLHKKSLAFLNTYLSKLRNMKVQRQIQTAELDKEFTVIELQVEHLEHRINEIKRLRMDYEAPAIDEYVALKDNKHNLQYHIKRLETKLHIKQIAVHSSQKQLLYLMNTSLTDTSGGEMAVA